MSPLLGALALFGSGTTHAAQPLVVYVVRHAEKGAEGDDPELTEAGSARAAELARMLREVPLTGVASTDWKRTKATAQPTATDHHLDLKLYDPPDALAATLIEARGTWLVVGHSNTVPQLVAALTGAPVSPDLGHWEYDRLTLVVRSPDDPPLVQVLRYGARSTPP